MKKVSTEYIINGWLEKYHGIKIEQLIKSEPELCKTSEWYKKYAVTQKQHDEWYEWAVAEICKATKLSKKAVKRGFAFDYLNVAPGLIDKEKIKNAEFDDIDHNDAPDYCDAYIVSAYYYDRPMTADELDEINEDRDFVHEKLLEWLS